MCLRRNRGDIMKKLVIQRKWCKGCRVCVDFCPKDVLDLDSGGKVYEKNPDKCIFCRLCELRCPDLAIEVQEEAKCAAETPCACSSPEKPKRKNA